MQEQKRRKYVAHPLTQRALTVEQARAITLVVRMTTVR